MKRNDLPTFDPLDEAEPLVEETDSTDTFLDFSQDLVDLFNGEIMSIEDSEDEYDDEEDNYEDEDEDEEDEEFEEDDEDEEDDE